MCLFDTLKEDDYILFEKKGSKVEVKKMVHANDLDNFARPIRERFQSAGITPDDVEEAIKWARDNKE